MPKRHKKPEVVDHGLELLLDYDGRVHYLDGGYCMKFKISRTETTSERPHGLSYSFTLHDEYNHRVLGYDNAHAPQSQGKKGKGAKVHDHWHRDENDKGRPYEFVDAATLLKDFFDECERVLEGRGIQFAVLDDKLVDGGVDD